MSRIGKRPTFLQVMSTEVAVHSVETRSISVPLRSAVRPAAANRASKTTPDSPKKVPETVMTAIMVIAKNAINGAIILTVSSSDGALVS
jgi:hypothetical protein